MTKEKKCKPKNIKRVCDRFGEDSITCHKIIFSCKKGDKR